jgi:hypothetical protein
VGGGFPRPELEPLAIETDLIGSSRAVAELRCAAAYCEAARPDPFLDRSAGA